MLALRTALLQPMLGAAAQPSCGHNPSLCTHHGHSSPCLQMWGTQDKRFVRLGPDTGFSSHYGHFDILMVRGRGATLACSLSFAQATCLPHLRGHARLCIAANNIGADAGGGSLTCICLRAT